MFLVVNSRRLMPLTRLTMTASRVKPVLQYMYFSPGLKFSAFWRVSDGHDVVVGDEVLRVAPAGQAEQRPLVAQAAGVVHHLTQGDALAEVGQFGNVFVDIVVERELALLLQQEDEKRR